MFGLKAVRARLMELSALAMPVRSETLIMLKRSKLSLKKLM